MEHYGLGTVVSKVITEQFVTKPKNTFEIACFVQRLCNVKWWIANGWILPSGRVSTGGFVTNRDTMFSSYVLNYMG